MVRKIKTLPEWGGLYLLPSLAGILVFFLWPFAGAAGYSFFDRPIDGSFAGLDNYAALFKNPAYLLGLQNTLKFMALCIPLNMALSLVYALMIENSPWRKGFTLLFLVPLVIPSGSMVFFWKNTFAAGGALNGLLGSLGMDGVNWLESDYGMAVVIFIFIWKNMGYHIILFLSGLSGVPKEQYEAAHMDGAGRLNRLIHITLPGLKSTMVVILVLSIINSFKVFKEVYLLTGSHPDTNIYMLQHYMNNMFASLNYPSLGAASVLMALCMGILAILFIRLERRKGT